MRQQIAEIILNLIVAKYHRTAYSAAVEVDVQPIGVRVSREGDMAIFAAPQRASGVEYDVPDEALIEMVDHRRRRLTLRFRALVGLVPPRLPVRTSVPNPAPSDAYCKAS